MLFKKKQQKEFKNAKEITEYIERLEKRVIEAEKRIEVAEKERNACFQKISINRFNPFKEMGGNQSFSLVMLDKKDNGFVITSLYTRDGNRVFVKPVLSGKSEYQLSEEEEKALKEAIEK